MTIPVVGCRFVDATPRIAPRTKLSGTPTTATLAGEFDFWFDGGAGRIITGWNDYDLANGTRVTVATNPALSITIDFTNGARVRIRQESRDGRIQDKTSAPHR